ncbi:MAG: hypothetical protein K2Y22_13780 [Candidatus Obscuribacterales bacterium]|nr:hypothetical protein [Candidatus Obscuribacterales bacterium]
MHANNYINTAIETIDLDGPLPIRGLDQSLFAKDNPEIALIGLLDRCLADHAGYLWIDASALLTPQGALVLLSGPSHSGKTTLTLSMALAHNWKILAEDIVLIDLKTGLLVPFARPLSLRSDTAGKIKTATGLDVGSFVLEGWLTNSQWYSLKPVPANFDLAIDLAVTDKDAATSLKINTVENGEFLRSLITHSNALRYDNGVQVLSSAFAKATLNLLSGGSPRDRINHLLKLGC